MNHPRLSQQDPLELDERFEIAFDHSGKLGRPDAPCRTVTDEEFGPVDGIVQLRMDALDLDP